MANIPRVLRALHTVWNQLLLCVDLFSLSLARNLVSDFRAVKDDMSVIWAFIRVQFYGTIRGKYFRFVKR